MAFNRSPEPGSAIGERDSTRHLALPIRTADVVIAHLLIDFCVLTMFAIQLKRLAAG